MIQSFELLPLTHSIPVMAVEVLEQPTLVLNRHWQPLGTAPVARALTKVWTDAARVVDPISFQLYDWATWANMPTVESDPVIRSTSGLLRVPQVVTMLDYDRSPDPRVTFSRQNLYRRDRHTCQYCGTQPLARERTIDHVVPRSQGGRTDWKNCVLACSKCNLRKADRTPEQAKMPLLRTPAQPLWRDLHDAEAPPSEVWRPFFGRPSYQS